MSDEEIMVCATSLRDQVLSMKFNDRKASGMPLVTISQGIRNSIPSETNKLKSCHLIPKACGADHNLIVGHPLIDKYKLVAAISVSMDVVIGAAHPAYDL